tara:strand:- start:107 stop:658 length:552 start_codon:yes stop_codon:yes gene_type:complete
MIKLKDILLNEEWGKISHIPDDSPVWDKLARVNKKASDKFQPKTEEEKREYYEKLRNDIRLKFGDGHPSDWEYEVDPEHRHIARAAAERYFDAGDALGYYDETSPHYLYGESKQITEEVKPAVVKKLKKELDNSLKGIRKNNFSVSREFNKIDRNKAKQAMTLYKKYVIEYQIRMHKLLREMK